MKTWIVCLALFTTLLLLVPTAKADQQGPSYSVGIGLSPIYIEEQIKNDQLTGGLTTLPIHTHLSTGYSFNSEYRVAVMVSHNWYVDAGSMVVTSGLLGINTTYSPIGFYNTYLKAGAGLAMKNRFSTAEMATGFGYMLGFGKGITERLSVEVSLQSLAFKEIAIDPDPDVSEDISSIQLSLVLLTF